MGEDNIIHGSSRLCDLAMIESNAPPRYDDHYLDRLYQDIPHDHFETPWHTPNPSGSNSPVSLSRQGSLENVAELHPNDQGRIPDASSRRRSRGGIAPLTALPAQPEPAVEEIHARFDHSGIDYPMGPTGSPSTSGGGTPRHLSIPNTRAHSPDGPRVEELDVQALSKVPSYTTAVRTGTWNLEPIASLPTYEGSSGSGSRPVSRSSSPGHSAPGPPATHPSRSGNDGQRLSFLGWSHQGGSEVGSGSSGGHSFLAEAERRLKLLQLRGK